MTRRTRYVPLLASDLHLLGACEEEVQTYARTFPDGATPTDYAQAVAAGLGPVWLVRALVGYQAHNDALAPIWKAYDDAHAELCEGLLTACWPVWGGDE